ncbi:unnamed protein product, partial [Mesorhabditis spiculigera]
ISNAEPSTDAPVVNFWLQADGSQRPAQIVPALELAEPFAPPADGRTPPVAVRIQLPAGFGPHEEAQMEPALEHTSSIDRPSYAAMVKLKLQGPAAQIVPELASNPSHRQLMHARSSSPYQLKSRLGSALIIRLKWSRRWTTPPTSIGLHTRPWSNRGCKLTTVKDRHKLFLRSNSPNPSHRRLIHARSSSPSQLNCQPLSAPHDEPQMEPPLDHSSNIDRPSYAAVVKSWLQADDSQGPVQIVPALELAEPVAPPADTRPAFVSVPIEEPAVFRPHDEIQMEPALRPLSHIIIKTTDSF